MNESMLMFALPSLVKLPLVHRATWKMCCPSYPTHKFAALMPPSATTEPDPRQKA